LSAIFSAHFYFVRGGMELVLRFQFASMQGSIYVQPGRSVLNGATETYQHRHQPMEHGHH